MALAWLLLLLRCSWSAGRHIPDGEGNRLKQDEAKAVLDGRVSNPVGGVGTLPSMEEGSLVWIKPPVPCDVGNSWTAPSMNVGQTGY
jgi:hypothetical protein